MTCMTLLDDSMAVLLPALSTTIADIELRDIS
jgi:hypothetical protein